MAERLRNIQGRIQAVLDAARQKVALQDAGENVQMGYEVEGWICNLEHVQRHIEDLLQNCAAVQGGQDRGSIIEVGPWGGPGGSHWDDGSYSGVKKILVRYGGVIDSISILYADQDGITVRGSKRGGCGGQEEGMVELDFPCEYLTSVTAYISAYGDDGKVISRLEFKSNRRTFPAFGPMVGTPVSFPVIGGKIVGFKGKSGNYLNALGVYLSPV